MKRVFYTLFSAALLLLSGQQKYLLAENVAPTQLRLAVLPFINYSETPAAGTLITELARNSVNTHFVVLANNEDVAAVLRSHRIRNTYELTTEQENVLKKALGVDYLIVGAVESYYHTESATEIALSAHLIKIEDQTISWANSVVVNSARGINILGLNLLQSEADLSLSAVNKLFVDFNKQQTQHHITALYLSQNSKAKKFSCEPIVIFPAGSDGETHFAENIFTDHLVTQFVRSGFNVVEPGRLQEMMSHLDASMRGQASADLLKACHDEFGASMVFTANVSRFGASFDEQDNNIEVSAETRLLDTETSEVLWARQFEIQSGGNVFFGLNKQNSPVSASLHLATKVIHSFCVEKNLQSLNL